MKENYKNLESSLYKTLNLPTLPVWFGLPRNFLLKRHHILSKYVNCPVYLLNNYSNMPQGYNSVPHAVNGDVMLILHFNGVYKSLPFLAEIPQLFSC